MNIIRKQEEIKILKTTDVLVVGGGPAGIGAAAAAARQGRSVILLEKRGFLGGNITACYVENANYFLAGTPFQSEGIYAEIEKGCKEKYGSDNIREYNKNAFNSEYLKVYLDEFLTELGVEIYFHAFVNETIVEDGRITAVIIQTKNGPVAVKADVVVDSTGDGDVAFSAGVPFEQGRDLDGLCQPGTVGLRFAGADVEKLNVEGEDRLREIGRDFKQKYRAGLTGLKCKRQDLPFGRLSKGGQISYVNYACAYHIDPTDLADVSRGEMECRQYIMDIYRYLKENYEELRNIEIASIGPEIGFRDSRRIEGHYKMSIEDMRSGKTYEDVIAVYPGFYDMLAPDAEMDGDGSLEGRGYKGHIFHPIEGDDSFQIPYRALIPVNIKNMLTAGRCISADHVAESGIRAISACMMTGQAAGTAAAMASAKGVNTDEIDIRELQDNLRSQGIRIPQ
ncbi:FAD-dependent oxidoreductase [Clostridium sp. MCC353]|uniref:FAD-dependent oxidoreductase n=1 Tax=Clostridium sp. MCC353 TaxID=2592646 RepID=UPI001C00D643|nr:FAD-dependent oxidoreductase [Clostridium sp. MCC353]MBT9777480.1 FAD-dependent oxidoreductase [Clostridium sp. MCC353]